jgi:hypothetical protein
MWVLVSPCSFLLPPQNDILEAAKADVCSLKDIDVLRFAVVGNIQMSVKTGIGARGHSAIAEIEI